MPTLAAAIDARVATKGASEFTAATTQMGRGALDAEAKVGQLDRAVDEVGKTAGDTGKDFVGARSQMVEATDASAQASRRAAVAEREETDQIRALNEQARQKREPTATDGTSTSVEDRYASFQSQPGYAEREQQSILEASRAQVARIIAVSLAEKEAASEAAALSTANDELAIASGGVASKAAESALATEHMGHSAGGAARSLNEVENASELAHRSIGKAIDSTLGLDHGFSQIIRHGTIFLGADLVARVFGFQGALDAVGKGLDFVADGLRAAGADAMDYLVPGFKSSVETGKNLEEQMKRIREERDKLTTSTKFTIGGAKFDVSDLKEDPKLYDRAIEELSKAREKIEDESERTYQALNSIAGGGKRQDIARTLQGQMRSMGLSVDEFVQRWKTLGVGIPGFEDTLRRILKFDATSPLDLEKDAIESLTKSLDTLHDKRRMEAEDQERQSRNANRKTALEPDKLEDFTTKKESDDFERFDSLVQSRLAGRKRSVDEVAAAQENYRRVVEQTQNTVAKGEGSEDRIQAAMKQRDAIDEEVAGLRRLVQERDRLRESGRQVEAPEAFKATESGSFEENATREREALNKALIERARIAKETDQTLDLEGNARKEAEAAQIARQAAEDQVEAAKSVAAAQDGADARAAERVKRSEDAAKASRDEDDALSALVESTRALDEVYGSILDTYDGLDKASEDWQSLLKKQRDAAETAMLPESQRKAELDHLEARNRIIEAGLVPTKTMIDLLAKWIGLEHEWDDARTKAEEHEKDRKREQEDSIKSAHEIMGSLRDERADLKLNSDERERAVTIRKLEELAAKDSSGEIAKLIPIYKEESEALVQDKEKMADAKEEASIFGSNLEDFAVGAKKGKDALKSLAEDLERFLVHKFVTKPLEGFLESLFSGVKSESGNVFEGGGLSFAGPSSRGNVLDHEQFQPAFPSARGNAFEGSRSSPLPSARGNAFEGSTYGGAPHVLRSEKGNVFSGADRFIGPAIRFEYGGLPTLPDVGSTEAAFPMAGGRFGTLREGGKPEAIMPLQRGPDGKLGVASHGGGSSTVHYHQNTYTMVQNIRTDSVAEFRASSRQLTEDGQRHLARSR